MVVRKVKEKPGDQIVNTLFGTVVINTEAEEQKQPFSPFKFIQDINYDKQYLYDETTQSDYNPWLTNISMSMFPDTLTHAVFLNCNSSLDKKMQHDYLFYAVQKRKRFKKDGWFKKSESSDLKFMEDAAVALSYSINKMKTVWTLLTEEQKLQLKEFVYPDLKNKKNK